MNQELARYVDVMIGNEEDFTACLGFAVPNTGGDLTGLEAENFKAMIGQVTAEFGFSVVATTLRGVISATVNDWGAIAWSAESRFVEATYRPALEIYDRVGGGDSFASGLIYGLLTTGDLQRAVDYGAAHGALAMTTPGDTSMASLAEVEPLVAGAGARVQRLSICYDHATVGLDRRQSGGKLFTSPNKPDAPNWVSATGGELAWRRW